MIDFKEGDGILSRIWTGPGQDLDRIWTKPPNICRNPARPGPGEAAPLSAAEHAPTPTHPHTPTHVDAIDFNTPRLSSFGKKKKKRKKKKKSLLVCGVSVFSLFAFPHKTRFRFQLFHLILLEGAARAGPFFKKKKRQAALNQRTSRRSLTARWSIVPMFTRFTG